MWMEQFIIIELCRLQCSSSSLLNNVKQRYNAYEATKEFKLEVDH